MRVEIYIEDSEEGEGVDARFAFMGGFSKDSGAHRLANMVRAYLDTVMQVREETPIETQVEQPVIETATGLH